MKIKKIRKLIFGKENKMIIWLLKDKGRTNDYQENQDYLAKSNYQDKIAKFNSEKIGWK